MSNFVETHHDVFVSYSSTDKPIADAACAALEGQGIRCWIAPRDIRPGQDWSEAIIDAIADCRIFLLVLSAASNHSEQVKREVQNAVSEARPVLPMRIEDVALSKHMRYFIGTPHWLDALTPPMERHLLRMVETVRVWLEQLDQKGGEAPAFLPPVPLDEPEHTEAALDPILIAATEKALAVFVGPLARVLAKRAAQKTHDRAEFHALLAEEIASPKERTEFLHRVQALA